MTRLATQSNPHFQVSGLELEREGRSYTIDTLTALSPQFPDTTFHLIIGGDSLKAFHTWRNPEAILEKADLLVYPRPQANLDSVSENILRRSTIFEVHQIDVSSSEIRQRFGSGRTVRYLIPDSVFSYIREYALYTSSHKDGR